MGAVLLCLFLVGDVPDGVGVLGDGPVGGKHAAAGDVGQAHGVPPVPVLVGVAHTGLRVAVGGEIRQAFRA